MLEKYNIESLKKQINYSDKGIWASPLNYEGKMDQPIKKDIYIHDVTLRDGEQAAGVVFSLEERLRIGRALSELGVKRIEAGLPTVSNLIFESMSKLVKMNLDAEIVSFARAHNDDIEATLHCGVRSIVIEHTLNPYLCFNAYGLSEQQLLDRLINSCKKAKAEGLHTTFMGWDFFRSPIEFTKYVYRQVVDEAKPDAIVLVDTFGVATPLTVYWVVKEFREMFPDVKLEFHCHNEFGWSTGAAITAISAGADGIHSAINGLGERTGNLPTEEIAVALEVLFGKKCGVKIDKLNDICKLVAEASNLPIPSNKPVMGSRVFQAESGVVVDVYNKMDQYGIKPAMTPYLPQIVGREPMEIVIGKGSGNSTVKRLSKKLGLDIPEENYEKILSAIKDLAYEKKGLLTEDDFIKIARSID